jgi:hypothetical protein
MIEDKESEYTEHQIRFYGCPKEVGTYFLGPICAHLGQRLPLAPGPSCWRCVEKTLLIGIYDVAPWGKHQEIQHTVMYRCPACGAYRQTGFEDGSDWMGGRLSFRCLVRLLPDPYQPAGRLRMTYESGGRRLNLDGESLRTGQAFQLFHHGAYHRGRVEVGCGDRFYFIFSESNNTKTLDLLPGMQARLFDS